MKRVALLFTLAVLAASLLAQVEVADIRVGSFRQAELLQPGRSGADHTRLIIELNALPQYDVAVEGSGLLLTLSSVACCDEGRTFPVDNGLISRVEMAQLGDDAMFHIIFDGRYESHEARAFDNPPRVVLDVRGTPAEALRQPPLIRSSTADGPVIERLGGAAATVRKLDMDELRELFPADAPLYLDLYEVPIANILRWFSQHCEYDIIAGAGVEGSVSLTLQNQTLAEAFALLLRSNGLAYERNGNVLTVSPASAAQAGDRRRHTVWVRYIDCLDMKSILAAHLPDDALLVQDSRSGRLDMLIPASAVAMVDSMAAAYDTPPPAYSFAVRPVLLPIEMIEGLPWRDDGSVVLGAEEWRTLEASTLGEGESRTLTAAMQREAELDGVYTKTFKTGVPLFTSSRVALPSGFELRLTPRVSPGRPSELDYTVRWRRVSRDLVSTTDIVSGSTPIRADEVILLYDEACDNTLDDWTTPRTRWVGGRKGAPALLVVPRLDHISLD